MNEVSIENWEHITYTKKVTYTKQKLRIKTDIFGLNFICYSSDIWKWNEHLNEICISDNIPFTTYLSIYHLVNKTTNDNQIGHILKDRYTHHVQLTIFAPPEGEMHTQNQIIWRKY